MKTNVLVAAAIVAGALAAPGTASADDAVLPAEVSADRPARVVRTTLDAAGRPVITVRTATDRPTARRLVRDGRRVPRTVAVEVDATIHITGEPAGSDPDRAEQWDFAKLGIEAAWQRSTGSGVTVAVIDTGVDAGHPDLAGNVLPGIDLITGTTGTSTDENGHGTHVAGTIAALTGNGIGVSSIAPAAKILPIRVLDANGSGDTSNAATGIVYAADHGADVINMSLGGTTQIAAVTEAVAYARSKGVTVVAAAGNDGQKGSPVNYPGADPGVIAVAATDSADQIAAFSTRGDYVDVAAPGVGILSTLPVVRGSYGRMNGTSMATPHVAAVAALLKAYRPGLTPDEIEQTLETTAVDLGSTGKDTFFGYGRIDPVAALDAAVPAPVVAVTTGSLTVAYGTSVTTRYTVTAAGEPLAGRTAQICTSTAGAAFACTAATTTAAGTVTVTVPATANRRIRLTVPATSTSAAVTSPTTTYTVRPVITLKRASAGRLTITMKGAGGQRLQLQRLVSGRWVQARTYPAAASRAATSLVAGATYRVTAPATTALAAATSNTAKA